MVIRPKWVINVLRTAIAVLALLLLLCLWMRFEIRTIPQGFDGADIPPGASVLVDVGFRADPEHCRAFREANGRPPMVFVRMPGASGECAYPTMLVGVAGDEIEVQGRNVLVNGKVRHGLAGGQGTFPRQVVPSGKAFILNANPFSRLPDSLGLGGFVDAERISGLLVMALSN